MKRPEHSPRSLWHVRGAGQAEKALKALQEATEATAAIEDARERAVTLIGVAHGYAGIGQHG